MVRAGLLGLVYHRETHSPYLEMDRALRKLLVEDFSKNLQVTVARWQNNRYKLLKRRYLEFPDSEP